jgi:molybdate transport system regulatory protein
MSRSTAAVGQRESHTQKEKEMTQTSRLTPKNNKTAFLPQDAFDSRAVRLMIRVAFGRHGALGPGKMRLLDLIDQTGSITAACRDMGMSYRRAWLLVEGLKRAFREPVLTTQQGGSSGGGCSLTPYGREVLRRYRALEQKAREAVRKDLQAFEAELLVQADIDAPADADDDKLAS